MNLEGILLGFKMIAMGRPQQQHAMELAEALAKVLATPEERLALTVQDEPADPAPTEDKPAASEGVGIVDNGTPKRRGRPPKGS